MLKPDTFLNTEMLKAETPLILSARCSPERLVPFEKFFAELDHFKTKRIVAHLPALRLVEHFKPRIKLPAGQETVGRSALQSIGVTVI